MCVSNTAAVLTMNVALFSGAAAALNAALLHAKCAHTWNSPPKSDIQPAAWRTECHSGGRRIYGIQPRVNRQVEDKPYYAVAPAYQSTLDNCAISAQQYNFKL